MMSQKIMKVLILSICVHPVTGIMDIIMQFYHIWQNQRSLLYQAESQHRPGTELMYNPEHMQSPDHPMWKLPFLDVDITAADGVKTHCWFIKQPNHEKQMTWLYFHGNAGNIGYRLPNFADLYHESKVNIMACDYRGYGNSDKVQINEEGILQDAEAAFEWLIDHNGAGVDPCKIVLFGRSLGGAVALGLAERRLDHEFPGIILENSFTNTLGMAKELLEPLKFIFDMLGEWAEYLIFDKWNNVKRIKQILAAGHKTSFLILTGTEDKIVPPVMPDELYNTVVAARAPQLKKKNDAPTDNLYCILNGEHHNLPTLDKTFYYEKINEFHQTIKDHQCN